MARPAINVENLAKSYLVGHQADQNERYVTRRDSIARHWHNFARKAVDVARGRQVGLVCIESALLNGQ
jgi:homopolymeric O-antigen transport system ATP-binding protein